MRKIETEFTRNPTPDRRMDWMASFEGYEEGDPIGMGETKEAAIEDLMCCAEI